MLKVTHDGGFFSCCGVRLYSIIDFFNTYKRLPEEVDSSEQFVKYKSFPEEDVSKTMFKTPINPQIEVSSIPIKILPTIDEPQFSNYSKINYKDITPFINTYFSLSDQILEHYNTLQTKYNIQLDNTCGVMYRGGDKVKETNVPSYKVIIDKAIEFQKYHPNVQFILQSDEIEFIREFQKTFPSAVYFEETFQYPNIQYYLASIYLFSKFKNVITTSGNGELFIALYRGHSNGIIQYLNRKSVIYGQLTIGSEPVDTPFWYEPPNVLIYSVNLGNYDSPVNHVEQTYPNLTYRVYTDDVDNISHDSSVTYEKAKKFRMGTPWLKDITQFDIAIYLDGNVAIIHPSFVEDIVQDHMNNKWDFLMTKHPSTNTASEEVIHSRQVSKYSKIGLNIMNKLVANCKEEVTWCGFNVQWLRSPHYKNLQRVFELWWDFVKIDPYGVANDQIMWPLVKKHLGHTINFKLWPNECYINHYFNIVYHAYHQPDPPSVDLDTKYNEAISTPSDINEHIATLYKYALECSHITECGVRSIVSSYAFANALKHKSSNKLIQVDPYKSSNIESFQQLCISENVKTVFHNQSDLECPLENTELLFIDTWHVYGQLKRELSRWNGYVSKYIILHDTTVDEIHGEALRNNDDVYKLSKMSGIPVEEVAKGLWPAITEFLSEHSEWCIKQRYTHNNGLTVLERVGYSWSFIDKVVYINLDERTDRKHDMENNILSAFDTSKVQRFPAVKHERGNIGCTRSHIEVLKLAIREGWKNVLILEDDAQWNKYEEGYAKLYELIQKPYDVILLSPSAAQWDPNTMRLIESETSCGYIVSSRYFVTLLKHYEEGLELLESTGNSNLYVMDEHWKSIQKRDLWYTIIPAMIYQRPGYSDIFYREVDYRYRVCL